MGKLCDRCSQAIPVWDDHLTFVKCRLAAGIYTLDISNPCLISESWSTITWGKLGKSLRDARQKLVMRGTQQWLCNVPALLVWMDSVSTSSELISETCPIADSDIRDVDLDSADVTAHSLVIEVSVHQGPVKALPAIDGGQAPTMDNLVPAPQCATLIMCVHAPPLASTSNQLLLASTSAAAPLLVTGPSFLPGIRAPISMLPGASVAFSGAPGTPPAPYRVPGCRQHHAECRPQGTVLQPMASTVA